MTTKSLLLTSPTPPKVAKPMLGYVTNSRALEKVPLFDGFPVPNTRTAQCLKWPRLSGYSSPGKTPGHQLFDTPEVSTTTWNINTNVF